MKGNINTQPGGDSNPNLLLHFPKVESSLGLRQEWQYFSSKRRVFRFTSQFLYSARTLELRSSQGMMKSPSRPPRKWKTKPLISCAPKITQRHEGREYISGLVVSKTLVLFPWSFKFSIYLKTLMIKTCKVLSNLKYHQQKYEFSNKKVKAHAWK